MSLTFSPVPAIKDDAFLNQDIRNGAPLLSINENLHLTGRAPMTQLDFTSRQKRLGVYVERVAWKTRAEEAEPVEPPALTPQDVAEFISALPSNFKEECDPLLAPYWKATEELERVEKIKPQLEEEIASILSNASGEDETAASRVTLLRARLELLPNNISVAKGRVKELHEPIWHAKSHAMEEGTKGLKMLEKLYKPALKRDLARHFQESDDAEKNAAGNLADNQYRNTLFNRLSYSLEQQRPGLGNSISEIVDWLKKINDFAAQWLPIITGS
jgi:hypothetical protein